jgi:hypothetical protein
VLGNSAATDPMLGEVYLLGQKSHGQPRRAGALLRNSR